MIGNNRHRRVSSVSLALAVGCLCTLGGDLGCTIIVKPGEPSPPPVFLTPFSCSASAVPTAPTADIFFDVRLERDVVEFTDRIGAFAQHVVEGAAAVGIMPSRASFVRLDERVPPNPLLAAYGCGLDAPTEVRPVDVLNYHAAFAPALSENRLGCALDPLRTLGEDLDQTVTEYPRDVSPDCDCESCTLGRSGLKPFGMERPDLVLIAHIDALPRRFGAADAVCDDAMSALTAHTTNAYGEDVATWLNYRVNVPFTRVVHWFIFTGELEARDVLVERCKRIEGFPIAALDHLAPSPVALYGPLLESLESEGAQAASLDFCSFLSDTKTIPFLVDQIADLADSLELDFSLSTLEDVVKNGLPISDTPSAGDAGAMASGS